MFDIPRLLLISDANILIDVEEGKLTPALFRLPYEIATPDFLFEQELREQHSHLLAAGLKVKSLSAELIRNVESLRCKYPKASFIDHSTLALAIHEQCPLLSGDKILRNAAIKEGVEVHGTLWIVGELVRNKLIEQSQARESFGLMKIKNRRLPWGDIDALFGKLNLDASKESM